MSDPYKLAYERERAARLQAETLLEDKTRALYDKVLELETTLSDLKTLQAQLVLSEKMASLGQLAAGVAHEINNPVGFSLANLQTLKEYLQPLFELDSWISDSLQSTQPELYQAYRAKTQALDLDYIKQDTFALLDETFGGLDRVREIVAGLKQISHSGENQAQSCDVNACIEDALKMVWCELKYKMQVLKQLNPLPLVSAQANEVQQVLINMFINAAQACEEGGELRICSFAMRDGDTDYAEICVCDNGKGMDEAVLQRIFDPFFTTKGVGEGTGLGLSISHTIIEKFKGQLQVSSQLGQGTSFNIRLPLLEPVATAQLKPKCEHCKLGCADAASSVPD